MFDELVLFADWRKHWSSSIIADQWSVTRAVAGHRIVTALRELRRWRRLVGVAGELPGVPRPPRPASTSPNGVRAPALEVGVPCPRGSRDRCRIRGGSSGLPTARSIKSRSLRTHGDQAWWPTRILSTETSACECRLQQPGMWAWGLCMRLAAGIRGHLVTRIA